MLTAFKAGELEGVIKQGIATFSLAILGPRFGELELPNDA
jgi:hypothetical protein